MNRKKKEKMREVVINRCFGGFGLSPEALLLLWERGMSSIGESVEGYCGDGPEGEAGRARDLERWHNYQARRPNDKHIFMLAFSPDEKFVLYGGRDTKRDDPLLVAVVKELGKKANGSCANLSIVKIPESAEWEISEYDGLEHVAEVHRKWP